MNAFRTLYRTILVLFAVVTIAIVALVHLSLSKIVTEQIRAQQQSLSPAVALIVDQLLKPLHISEALGRSQELVTLMDQPSLDEATTFAMLSRLQREFGLSFFVASENARMQYLSDGSRLALKEGLVDWYFKYKEKPADAFADIGKWEDTHFYIDIKIYNAEKAFLGFFGIGKSLASFLSVFEQYKQQYGYNFLFVNESGDIMLSSDPLLWARYAKFTNLNELSWFSELPEDVKKRRQLNNLLVTINNTQHLITEVSLNQFGWHVYLLSPLDARQAEISQGLVVSIVVLLVVIFSLFLLVYNLLFYFRKEVQTHEVVTPLTRLPSVTALTKDYAALMTQHQHLSMVVISIDELDQHRTKYGDSIVNELEQLVVAFVKPYLREIDRIGKLETGKFVVLLSATGPHESVELMTRIRKKVQAEPVQGFSQLWLLLSIGVTFTATPRPFNTLLGMAQDALHQANRDGNNAIRLRLDND